MNPATATLDRLAVLAAVLVTARAIVCDPARWCAWPEALDANGHSCGGRNRRAARWGALGALDRAAADAGAAHNTFLTARQHLNDASIHVARNWKRTPWLLDHDAAHAMTLAVFDEAIRILRKPPAPTVFDALAVARILIASPDRWTRGAIALDRRGKALSTFERGCRFCAAGALGLAIDVLHGSDPSANTAGPASDDASRLLDCAAFKLGGYESYIGLNEHDSHAQVLAMFDHALDMAPSQPATAPEAT